MLLGHPLGHRARSGGRRPSGTTRTTRGRSPTASLVGRRAQGHREGRRLSFTNVPIGCVAAGRPPRGRCRSCASPPRAARPTANEHSPRPSSPTWRWPSSLLVAPQSGGCGLLAAAWAAPGASASASARPSNSYSSLVQQPTTCPIASGHISRVWCGSMPKPSSSARVDDRPVPKSTRPFGDQVEHGGRLGRAHRVVVGLGHEPHAVAEPDALGLRGDRAVEHLGVRAVRVLLEEVVLDGPEGVPAELLAGDRLLDACPGRPGARSSASQGRATGIS